MSQKDKMLSSWSDDERAAVESHRINLWKPWTTSIDRIRDEVFDITEILEKTLLGVPFYDLFKCQRVNQRFRDVIRGSTLIQQKMFLLPREKCSTKFSTCPVLDIDRERRRRKGPNRHKARDPDVVCGLTPPVKFVDGTSWMDLHLTQPPVKEVRGTFRWEVRKDDDNYAICAYTCQGPVCNPEGFTVGGLLKAVLCDVQGTMGMNVGGSLRGRQEEFLKVCRTAGEVLEMLERELGTGATFEGGALRFSKDRL